MTFSIEDYQEFLTRRHDQLLPLSPQMTEWLW